jgi:GT2 family glycosyltransferase/glycosyltransferase involved in cell wall biosynthesis
MLRIQPGEPLGCRRGEVVVVIPVYGALDLFQACLASVLAQTPAQVRVLVADDATPDLAGVERALGGSERVAWFRQPANLGFVGNVNSAFRSAAPADVVILNSDVEVPAGWLERLREAANCDSVVATATPLTNHGTILSVPWRNRPSPSLPEGWTLEAAARAVAEASPRLRPRIPTAIGHCTYVKRSALELVGDFDTAFAPAYGEEVDFSQRCLLRGLSHVAADDVLVLHHGSASFGAAGSPIQERHERMLADRYPHYHAEVRAAASSVTSPLARSLLAARQALVGLSVTIDGSCLGPTITGTEVATLEVIQALARSGRVRLRVALPGSAHPHARAVLESLPEVETIRWEDVGSSTPASDIVHRTCQVGRTYELRRLLQMGERIVITQQDFIAYRNPGYFDSVEEWHLYRQLARSALAVADRIVFISEHAACDARAEDIVEPGRGVVVHGGVDHHHSRIVPEPVRPSLANAFEASPFMLCLGTDFRHKNRLFALRVLDELQRRHEWDGRLVLAGPRASPGSSAPDEQLYLEAHPRVAAATFDLGPVTEGEKLWLLSRAALAISPTTYEGFGLIPFEAAEAGLACLFAPQASMEGLLPAEAALIVPWDAGATADRAHELLSDPARREELVRLVREAAGRYPWDATATRLLEVYADATRGPVPGGRLVAELGGHYADPAGSELRVLDPRKVWRFWRSFGFVNGTRRGVRGLGRRLRMRLRGR